MSADPGLFAPERLFDGLSDALDDPAADIAPLLRGRAREHDADAFELLGRLGYAPAAIAAALPRARRLARASRQEIGA